jgi:Putative  PD-(D/E)XK family member, (DUF4420)
MKPSEAWASMGEPAERNIRVCVRMGDGVELPAVRGGRSGDGEVALRLPAGLQNQQLGGPWSGIHIDRFERASEPGVYYLTAGPDPGYRAIFSHLCDDLSSVLEGAQDSRDAESRMLQHLRLWSGFLRPSGSRMDSRTARGLFGELRFLEDVLAPVLGWKRAILAWEGPSGAMHDINLRPRLSLDIKTTVETDQLATISSLEQLESQDISCLLIAQGVVLEGQGEHLGDLVARISAAADTEGAGGLLRARLSRITILNSQDMGPLMDLHAWHFHRVDDPAFPRLLRASLPRAIRQCSYQVDLSAHTAPRPTLEDVTALIHTSAHKEDG